MILIGIDPGSRKTGYGVIEVKGQQLRHIESGMIATPLQASFAQRLTFLHGELLQLYGRYPNSETAIERIFYGKNIDSAFKLGHARGVCMQVAAGAGSNVAEYAARVVKKIVTGHGNSSKETVQMVVSRLLNIQNFASLDASDALSLALCHFFESQRVMKMKIMEGKNLI